MASRFEDTKPVVRDLSIDGHGVRVTLDANGVHFIRKGDKHRVKKTLSMEWQEILATTHQDPFGFLELVKTGSEPEAAADAEDDE